MTPPPQSDDFIFFDMSALHDQVSKHWNCLPELLSLWHESGDICRRREEYDKYIGGAFDTMYVTITAMPRDQPWFSKLVVATSGFHDNQGTQYETRMPVMLHPRRIASHTDSESDEDWVSVCVVVNTAESEQKVGTFLGVEIALMCYGEDGMSM